MRYYAHSDREKDKSRWHLLKDHLEDTGAIASSFARAFDAEKLAYVAGLLHDIGKYAPEFQDRLEGRGIKVDHSTPGAVVMEKRYGPSVGRLLAYVISGHHCGLPDWGSIADESSLEARLTKELNDYQAFESEIALPLTAEVAFPPIRPLIGAGFSAQFLIRFLYSCLVDADFLDTERALNVEQAVARNPEFSLAELSNRLDRVLDNLCSKAPDTIVNKKRAEVLASCREKAKHGPGLFTLTVPTGGGKTLSSLSFALRHALTYHKDRVIYVIPYTSIIEQNASVFRKILGDRYVLEHHSNLSYPLVQAEIESENATDISQRLRLATENWDMPIIVTTNVQFFESLFAARSSKCRKLHNISNSVVIIDEAQMIPTGYLKPCLNAVVELVTNYRATVVLCTATQPAIKQLLPEGTRITEITDNPDELYEKLRRVKVRDIGTPTDDELLDKLAEHDQVLCIVNSKKHARVLYEKLHTEDAFHLSTRMCPAHRTEVLKAIKERLGAGSKCQVVSTQLVEAGVDLDFPVVYRSMAGIDSIAQAAGRCNREGLRSEGQVYVFWPEKHGMPGGWLSRTATLGGMVFKRLDDPLALKGVEEYFASLYDIDANELDRKGIMLEIKEQETLLRFPFRSIAEKFKLIDDNTSTVVIPWDDVCRRMLQEAGRSPIPGSYVRMLQRYGVGVYEQELKELLEYGTLEVVGERFYALREEVYQGHYCQRTGLRPFTESMLLNDTLII